MAYIMKAVNQIASKGNILAGVFLIGMMMLTVANVALRFFGGVIAGTYELTEIMNVVVIGCALGFAILEGSQVVVDIIVSRLPSRLQELLEGLMSLLAMLFWGIVAWASFLFMIDRWGNEKTEMLKVPFLPFRFIWFFGLVFVLIAYSIKCVTALRGKGK